MNNSPAFPSADRAPHEAHALQYLALPAFQDNYIWLVTDGRAAAVVDPGEAAPVEAMLAARGLRLSVILLTHHHHDHVGGVAALLAARAGSPVPVYGPAGEAIPHVDHPLADGDRVHLQAPAAWLEVLDVPGHTAGHIAYFQAAHGQNPPHLFCGDTLFASGCGRLFEGTPRQMLSSLDALAALPDATLVHCAHEYTLSNLKFALACEPGNAHIVAWRARAEALREQGLPTLPTTLAHERRVNPFLRVDRPELRQALADTLGEALPDRLSVFTEMRAWKDRFH